MRNAFMRRNTHATLYKIHWGNERSREEIGIHKLQLSATDLSSGTCRSLLYMLYILWLAGDFRTLNQQELSFIGRIKKRDYTARA